MKKTAILVVCVLLLCGGLCHLYLTATAQEAEDLARPAPIRTFSPVMPAEGSFLIAETSTPQPVPRPVIPTGVIHVQTMETSSPFSPFSPFTPGPSSTQILEQPVHPVAAFPVASQRTVPDIGKFRLPIEYKLKNVPVASLIDFLKEEFSQVKAEALEEAGAISITASLTDHRTITTILIELERDIAALRSAAANVAEAAEEKIRGFFVEHDRPTDLATEQLPTFDSR